MDRRLPWSAGKASVQDRVWSVELSFGYPIAGLEASDLTTGASAFEINDEVSSAAFWVSPKIKAGYEIIECKVLPSLCSRRPSNIHECWLGEVCLTFRHVVKRETSIWPTVTNYRDSRLAMNAQGNWPPAIIFLRPICWPSRMASMPGCRCWWHNFHCEM